MNNKTASLVIQLTASVTTLLGVHYGSTTLLGSSWYIISQVLWWTIMIRDKMWGLLPLNVAMAGILTHNFFRAISS